MVYLYGNNVQVYYFFMSGSKVWVILPYLLFFKLFLCILLAVAFYTIWNVKY